MNIIEKVRLELTQVNSNATRKLYDEQIIYFLNKAYERFILERVRKRDGTTFEYDTLDADAIQPFLKSFSLEGNITTITLPDDFSLFISIRTKIKGIKRPIPVRVISSALFDITDGLPFYGSTASTLISKYLNKKLNLSRHKETDVIERTDIVYVKKINEISKDKLQLELDSKYENSIVDLAVLIGKELLGDPNWQLKERDNQKNITLN